MIRGTSDAPTWIRPVVVTGRERDGSADARKQVKSVRGKVVAITGGAGDRQGDATALVRRGARIAIGTSTWRSPSRPPSELGGGVVRLRAHVNRSKLLLALSRVGRSELGPLDVLINNAGIMPVGPFVEETDETARLMVEINLHGVIYGTKLALERMQPRRSGHIVNIASQAGKAGLPGGATYCATKHAVVGLSEAVRAEVRDDGIEVSCVMPAVVNTELADGLPDTRGVTKLEPEDVADAIVEAIETNRFDVWVPRSTATIAVMMNLMASRRSRTARAVPQGRQGPLAGRRAQARRL